MLTFGQYTVTRELPGHPDALLFEATNPADAEDPKRKKSKPLPRYIVKWHRRLGEGDHADEIKHLKTAIKLQHSLAQECPRHWAQVYQLNEQEGGPFFVTPYYEETLADLLKNPPAVTAADVATFADGMLHAFIALRDKALRPHANLNPGNIYLPGKGRLARRTVVLGDLAHSRPGKPLPFNNECDLRALGLLLYQIIARRESTTSLVSVPKSEDWSHLGKDGESWKTLVNALLVPDRLLRERSLEDLLEIVDELRPFPLVPVAAAGGGGLAALIVLGFVVASFFGGEEEPPASSGLEPTTPLVDRPAPVRPDPASAPSEERPTPSEAPTLPAVEPLSPESPDPVVADSSSPPLEEMVTPLPEGTAPQLPEELPEAFEPLPAEPESLVAETSPPTPPQTALATPSAATVPETPPEPVIETPAPQIGAESLPPARAADPYQTELVVLGGESPLRWMQAGDPLPPGLRLQRNGTLEGTPSTPGSYRFRLRVTDAVGRMDEQVFSLAVAPPNTQPRILTTAAPNGRAGESWRLNLDAESGDPPFIWEITAGRLPAGLSLSGDIIEGIPTEDGDFRFTVAIVDTDGDGDSHELSFSLAPANKLPAITETRLPVGEATLLYTAQLQATSGNPPLVWSIGSGQLPPGVTLTPEGLLSGRATEPGDFTWEAVVTDTDGDEAKIAVTTRILRPQTYDRLRDELDRVTNTTPVPQLLTLQRKIDAFAQRGIDFDADDLRRRFEPWQGKLESARATAMRKYNRLIEAAEGPNWVEVERNLNALEENFYIGSTVSDVDALTYAERWEVENLRRKLRRYLEIRQELAGRGFSAGAEMLPSLREDITLLRQSGEAAGEALGRARIALAEIGDVTDRALLDQQFIGALLDDAKRFFQANEVTAARISLARADREAERLDDPGEEYTTERTRIGRERILLNSLNEAMRNFNYPAIDSALRNLDRFAEEVRSGPQIGFLRLQTRDRAFLTVTPDEEVRLEEARRALREVRNLAGNFSRRLLGSGDSSVPPRDTILASIEPGTRGQRQLTEAAAMFARYGDRGSEVAAHQALVQMLDRLYRESLSEGDNNRAQGWAEARGEAEQALRRAEQTAANEVSRQIEALTSQSSWADLHEARRTVDDYLRRSPRPSPPFASEVESLWRRAASTRQAIEQTASAEIRQIANRLRSLSADTTDSELIAERIQIDLLLQEPQPPNTRDILEAAWEELSRNIESRRRALLASEESAYRTHREALLNQLETPDPMGEREIIEAARSYLATPSLIAPDKYREIEALLIWYDEVKIGS